MPSSGPEGFKIGKNDRLFFVVSSWGPDDKTTYHPNQPLSPGFLLIIRPYLQAWIVRVAGFDIELLRSYVTLCSRCEHAGDPSPYLFCFDYNQVQKYITDKKYSEKNSK